MEDSESKIGACSPKESTFDGDGPGFANNLQELAFEIPPSTVLGGLV